MTLDIQKFDPTVEQLQKIAELARAVVVTDMNDKKQLEAVSAARKDLKAWRVKITNYGKTMREEAVKFQKDVIAKERELIALIEPEEQRLLEIEAEAETAKERAKMALLLPARRARIAAINYTGEVSDDRLNSMTIPAFEGFFVSLQSEMNARESKRLAEESAKVEAEKKRQAEEQEKRDREERVRKEERERLEREEEHKRKQKEQDAKDAAAKIEREAKEKAQKIIDDAKAEAEKAARIQREKEEAELRRKQAELGRKEAEERKKKEEAEAADAERRKQQSEKAYLDWYKAIVAKEPEAIYRTAQEDDGTLTVWKQVGTYTHKVS